jgi:hypothetical protein
MALANKASVHISTCQDIDAAAYGREKPILIP